MSDDLITLQTFASLSDAELARGLLESYGISVFLADQNIARLKVPGAVGWVRLQVSEADLAEAREILAAGYEWPSEEPGPE